MDKETRNLILIGGAAVAAFMLLRKAITAVPQVFTDTGEYIGGALFDWLNPGAAGESIFYTTTFPDNSRHAVPGSTVGSDGSFTYGGASYTMKTDASGNHIAVPA